MPKEERNNQFIAIKSMFISGSVRKMKDIEKLSPTKVAKALHMNHSRYIHKLYNPEQFKIIHLKDLANLLDLDIQIIWDVILKQVNTSLKMTKKRPN
jgi:hypothetical protein